MFNRILVLIVTLFSLSLLQVSFAQDLIPQQMVVFGDSYSDNGNTFAKSNNTYPGKAYSLGRFSNGPTWSEYLAIKLGIDTMNTAVFRNYAHGEAMTIGDATLVTHNDKNEWKFTLPDLSGEIDEYVAEGNIKPDKTIYFIFIGTNDLLSYQLGIQKNNQQFVYKQFSTINQQIDRLKKMGAKKIVLFAWRDLKHFPLTKQIASRYKQDYIAALEEMIKQFNQTVTNQYQNDSAVYVYDTYQFDQQVFNSVNKYTWKKEEFSLTDKENGCYQHGGNYIDLIADKYCAEPWTHWFFDRIHPTTYVEYLMSQDVYSFLLRQNLIGP
jgi:thermolabile hemolysin